MKRYKLTSRTDCLRIGDAEEQLVKAGYKVTYSASRCMLMVNTTADPLVVNKVWGKNWKDGVWVSLFAVKQLIDSAKKPT